MNGQSTDIARPEHRKQISTVQVEFFVPKLIAQPHIAAATKSAIQDTHMGALQAPITKDRLNMTRRM
jgi:hypothetical protein